MGEVCALRVHCVCHFELKDRTDELVDMKKKTRNKSETKAFV